MRGFTRSTSKEKEPQGYLSSKEEEIRVREAQETAEISKEIQSYITHVEEEPRVPEELSQLGVTSPAQTATRVLTEGPTIILPISEGEVKEGLLAPVWQALRWLAEWSMRVAKMGAKHGTKVVFRKEGEQ